MARLLVHVEGQTEEVFVNEILRPHLFTKGYHSVEARILGNTRLRARGGIKSWPSVRQELANHLKGDRECIVTTMVDYYGLPALEDRAWPGRAAAATLSTAERKAAAVESALLADLQTNLSDKFNPSRFVPFVLMHEFEALLFSDCHAFARGIWRPEIESDFQRIRDAFETPEDINDSKDTAPSKRVEALVSGYVKPLWGPLAVIEIGLAAIRTQCPHFAGWLTKLESLVA